MSTGLTFGTISALYGLGYQVIASAVVPTLIANAFFLPYHLSAACRILGPHRAVLDDRR